MLVRTVLICLKGLKMFGSTISVIGKILLFMAMLYTVVLMVALPIIAAVVTAVNIATI